MRRTENDDENAEVQMCDLTPHEDEEKPLVEWKRFGPLAVGAFAAICASTPYSFNLFSGSLQKKYSFSQRDLSSVNTVGMVFSYFLLPYGFLFDYFGPFPVFLLAGSLSALGALLFGLSFGDHIGGSTILFCVYNALLSLGSQLFDLASLVTLLSFFPTNRGDVVALMKTLTGLGVGILGAFYYGFFNGHPDRFFYFLMGVLLCVSAVSMSFVRLPSYHLTGYQRRHLTDEENKRRTARKFVYLAQKAPRWRFICGSCIIYALIVYLPTQSALVAYLHLGRSYQIAFAVVVAVFSSLFAFLGVPCDYMDKKYGGKEEVEEKNEPTPMDDKKEGDIAITGSSADQVGVQKQEKSELDYIAPQYQTTILQSVCCLELWALFWAFFCAVGSGFVVIFNARFVFGALIMKPVDDSMGTLLTVLTAVGSALGRLSMCYLEVWSQRRKAEERIPITISMFIPTTIMIVSIVLFLVLPSQSLLLAFFIAALGNGFSAAVSILVVRTIYAKDPAMHYNFAFNALWLSSVLLNRLLYGEWYAREADKHGSILCYGKSCVLMPLLVLLFLNVSGLFASAFLHIRYSRFSKRTLEERRRLREMQAGSVLRDTPMDGMSNPGEVTTSA